MHLMIVGGGYAGTMALGRLRMALPDARLTLVDPRTHFEARIHNHRRAVGGHAPDVDYAVLCKRWTADHVQERLLSIEGRRLTLESGTVEPDGVILALGSRTAAPEGTWTLDDAAQASGLGDALKAVSEVDVVGAGTTGLEAATAIAVAHPHLRVRLYSTTPLLEAVEQRLHALKIEIYGRWQGGQRLTVWCGGMKPVQVQGLPEQHGEDLQVSPGVFVAGDLARTGHRTGCVTAMPLGCHAAANLVRWLRDEPTQPFAFKNVLTCVDLGGAYGLVEFEGGTRFAGLVAGATKSSILTWVRGAYAMERALGMPLYTWAA